MGATAGRAAPDGPLRAAIRELGARRSYRRGEPLFLEGETADRVFLVERGLVTVRCSGPEGDEMILGLRGAGEVLGEMSALDGAPRSATAIAAADVEALVVGARAMAALVEQDVGVANDLLQVMLERLRSANVERLELMWLDTAARVARRLLDVADRVGVAGEGGVRVELPLSQEELASWCGSSREATVKGLRKLREAGAITTGRRLVTITDRALLVRHARLA